MHNGYPYSVVVSSSLGLGAFLAQPDLFPLLFPTFFYMYFMFFFFFAWEGDPALNSCRVLLSFR